MIYVSCTSSESAKKKRNNDHTKERDDDNDRYHYTPLEIDMEIERETGSRKQGKNVPDSVVIRHQSFQKKRIAKKYFAYLHWSFCASETRA